MELSTYFRINASETGQFERTLIIADKGSYVSYLEGCTAPMRDENQLHAANVELIALDDAEIKYSTIQNWYPGDEDGKGGIYNFVTKRGACRGKNSKISWTQVETGSAITWKYPSCILQGDNSVGEFYSVAITNNYQKADTGTKMIHLGKNTKSKIISKGISAGHGDNTYRGLVIISSKAKNSRNYTQCDSLLMGNKCGAHTVPYIENKNSSSNIEHEATPSKISEEQLFYCNQRGLNKEGKETTDPKEISKGGVLLPFGGYKGSAIAMMVELLAGALIGETFSYETAAKDNNDGGPPSGGEFILAISPEKIAGPDWGKHSDEFLKKMSSLDGVRLPGERRHKNRLDTSPRKINADLVKKIKSLSQ